MIKVTCFSLVTSVLTKVNLVFEKVPESCFFKKGLLQAAYLLCDKSIQNVRQKHLLCKESSGKISVLRYFFQVWRKRCSFETFVL